MIGLEFVLGVGALGAIVLLPVNIGCWIPPAMALVFMFLDLAEGGNEP